MAPTGITGIPTAGIPVPGGIPPPGGIPAPGGIPPPGGVPFGTSDFEPWKAAGSSIFALKKQGDVLNVLLWLLGDENW